MWTRRSRDTGWGARKSLPCPAPARLAPPWSPWSPARACILTAGPSSSSRSLDLLPVTCNQKSLTSARPPPPRLPGNEDAWRATQTVRTRGPESDTSREDPQTGPRQDTEAGSRSGLAPRQGSSSTCQGRPRCEETGDPTHRPDLQGAPSAGERLADRGLTETQEGDGPRVPRLWLPGGPGGAHTPHIYVAA